MAKPLNISKKELHNHIEKKTKRNTIYLCLFMSICFLDLGFSRYEDIKEKGYYIESKYQVLINGENGAITVYVLLFSGFVLLSYTMYLVFQELKKNLG